MIPNNIQISNRISEEDTCKLKNNLECVINAINAQFSKCVSELSNMILENIDNLENYDVEFPTKFDNLNDLHIVILKN